jgi:hypothetical protein
MIQAVHGKSPEKSKKENISVRCKNGKKCQKWPFPAIKNILLQNRSKWAKSGHGIWFQPPHDFTFDVTSTGTQY